MRCTVAFWFNTKSRATAERTYLRQANPYDRWPWILALGSLYVCCLLAAADGSGAGALSGSVVDDSGKPVAGARVLISHAPPPGTRSFPAPPTITGPLATQVIADGSGSFHADGLAPGQYIACAEATTPGFLDPCHWAASAPGFTLSAGQTISDVKIVMAKGPVLQVHINDPMSLLTPVAGPVDQNLQIHVVTSKGIHYSAPIQSSTTVGRDLALTIPFATPVTLRVVGAHVTVNDQSGKTFSTPGTAINVPAGTAPAVIQLNVTGKK